MARMVAVGPEHFTLAFGAVGFEMVEVKPADFIETLGKLVGDRGVGLVVCGESFVTDQVMEEFKEVCATARATVIVVPDGPEMRGVGREIVRAHIERAAGVDLLGSIEPAAAPGEQAEDC